MPVYNGKYTEKSVSDSSFKQNKDFLDSSRAAEGEAPNKPVDPSLKYTSGKGGKPVDPDLKYSGGNDGHRGKDKNWS